MIILKYLRTLIILTLFFPLHSVSQDQEYVVTNTHDTIYGKVIRATHLLNPSKVMFKIKDDKGKKTLINPSEVHTIRSIKGVDGDCYITTIYDKWFLKRIIDGRIKVYQLIDGVLLYVSKDDSNMVSTDIGGFFSAKKAHSQVRPLIKDQPDILKEFDSLPGHYKNVIYILQKYNKVEK